MMIRPPGTAVPDGLMFYRRCYLFLFRHSCSEVRRPIALKLCHMVGIWCNFITPLQKFGRLSPQKNWGPKTCKISVNFGPLQTLIANISGTVQDIQNRPTLQTMGIPPAFDEKKSGELWSTNGLELHVSLDPLKCTIWETIFQPIGGAAPSYFYTR